MHLNVQTVKPKLKFERICPWAAGNPGWYGWRCCGAGITTWSAYPSLAYRKWVEEYINRALYPRKQVPTRG